MRQLDSSIAASRNLQFFAYDIEASQETLTKLNLKTQFDELNFLKENKFFVNSESVICHNIRRDTTYI